MRFNDRITFIQKTDSHYDPLKGEYVEGEKIEFTFSCNISQLGVERTNELFGSIDTVITVARLQRPFRFSFDYAVIDEQPFKVRRQSNYRKGVFFLEGINRVRVRG